VRLSPVERCNLITAAWHSTRRQSPAIGEDAAALNFHHNSSVSSDELSEQSQTPESEGEVTPSARLTASTPMRLIIRPMFGPPAGIDITHRVVTLIAQELWRLHGGNDVVNWLEAERLLDQAILHAALHRQAADENSNHQAPASTASSDDDDSSEAIGDAALLGALLGESALQKVHRRTSSPRSPAACATKTDDCAAPLPMSIEYARYSNLATLR